MPAARLTDGDGQASSIAWSRDSSRIAYSYSDSEGASVRVLSTCMMTLRIVYPTDGAPMTGLDWSADGSKLVGARWTAMRSADDRGPVEGIPKPTIKVVRRLRYKQDGVGWVHDRFLQIWVLELETGDLVQVTHSECDYSSPNWSNRGDRLAFVGMAREQNTPLGYGQIFICDYPESEPRLLLPDWARHRLQPGLGRQRSSYRLRRAQPGAAGQSAQLLAAAPGRCRGRNRYQAGRRYRRGSRQLRRFRSA